MVSQLEKGSTATDFTPYQSGEYEINLGKNLINFDSFQQSWAGASVDGEGTTITMSPNTSGSMGILYDSTTYSVSIPAGRMITWSRTWGGGGTWESGAFAFPLELTYSDGTTETLSFGDTTERNYSQVISATKTLTKSVVSVKIKSGGCFGITNLSAPTSFNLQLELGSTPTSYAPYFTPIELCKIGDYQDYIYENEGKWYLHKAVGKYTFTSSETVSYQSNFPRFMINFSRGQDATAGVAALAKSTHFVVGQTASVDGRLGIAASVIYLHNSAITSADGLKTWFGNNNVSVYFALATPTDTEITNTALIDQLNALKNGGSYTGTTYIKVSATDPNLPGLLEVEAYKYD
jgi:hypothetical protein